MPTCRYCGREIEFRYLNGQCTPIHVNGGGRCNGVSGGGGGWKPISTSSGPIVYRYEQEDFCHSTRCPICHASVYFIRHNGGCVWVDELGWPWPKHPCFDDAASSAGHRVFHVAAAPTNRHWVAGRVARIVVEGAGNDGYTLLAIWFSDNTRMCLSLRGRHREFAGQVVFVDRADDGSVRRLLDSRGEALTVTNAHLDPRLLNLPRNWIDAPGPTRPPAPPPPPPGPQPKSMTVCPKCSVLVRVDRLPRHLRKVHRM